MLGAIIGDIVGSRFEWKNHKDKNFELFHEDCFFTDDTVMTIAIAQSLMSAKFDYHNLADAAIKNMRNLGNWYTNRGYGGNFLVWLAEDDMGAYNSFGNGAAMRVSACGFAAKSMEECVLFSREATRVTHNHPEGLKGAEATAVSIYLAKTGSSKNEIRDFVREYYYPLDFTLDEIRPKYYFDVSCQGSVPQAIEAFLEGNDYEDVIRNAISIGGDSDTIGAIAGGIAEAYYGIPNDIKKKGMKYLDDKLRKIVNDFYNSLRKD